MPVYEDVGKESDFIEVTSKRSAGGSPVVVAVKSEGETNGHPASVVLTVYPLDGRNAKLAEVARAGRVRYIRDEKAAAEYELTGANSRKGLPKQSPSQLPVPRILSAADVFKGERFEQPADGSGLGTGAGLGAARGSIRFPAAGVGRGDTVISTFAGADLSTVAHETAHYFPTVMQDMARTDPAGAIAAEFDAIRDWWHKNADEALRVTTGVVVTGDDVRLALDAGTTGDAAKDASINVGMQEQFARGAEAYLMEGKAPSIALRSAFEKFRVWLVSIYRRALGLNAVFDRMLATDEEIARTKDDAGAAAPVFATAEEMGLSAQDYAKFRKLYTGANDELAAKTQASIMAPIRRAATAAYKAERKALTEAEAVSAEVDKEMAKRHNDPLLDGSVPQIALDAAHADKRGLVIAAELAALNEIAGYDRGLTVKEARETARRTLRGMAVRDAIRSDRFLTAERKARR